MTLLERFGGNGDGDGNGDSDGYGDDTRVIHLEC
jgi:hypothetical protein